MVLEYPEIGKVVLRKWTSPPRAMIQSERALKNFEERMYYIPYG